MQSLVQNMNGYPVSCFQNQRHVFTSGIPILNSFQHHPPLGPLHPRSTQEEQIKRNDDDSREHTFVSLRSALYGNVDAAIIIITIIISVAIEQSASHSAARWVGMRPPQGVSRIHVTLTKLGVSFRKHESTCYEFPQLTNLANAPESDWQLFALSTCFPDFPLSPTSGLSRSERASSSLFIFFSTLPLAARRSRPRGENYVHSRYPFDQHRRHRSSRSGPLFRTIRGGSPHNSSHCKQPKCPPNEAERDRLSTRTR